MDQAAGEVDASLDISGKRVFAGGNEWRRSWRDPGAMIGSRLEFGLIRMDTRTNKERERECVKGGAVEKRTTWDTMQLTKEGRGDESTREEFAKRRRIRW